MNSLSSSLCLLLCNLPKMYIGAEGRLPVQYHYYKGLPGKIYGEEMNLLDLHLYVLSFETFKKWSIGAEGRLPAKDHLTAV